MSDTLQQLRNQLDTVDSQIVKLIEERFQITDEVAVYKDIHGIPLTDRKRELELLETIRNKIQHPVLKEHISELYEKIFVLNKTARLFKQHKYLPFTKIGVIGMGFIGGSIVKGLKMKNPELEIYTVERDSDDIRLALSQKYLSTTVASMQELVDTVELIILASPIDTVVPLANQIVQCTSKNNLLVIDIASVKEHIVTEFENLSGETIEFLGTHPMAGSEKMGFEHAEGMVFVKKPWAITAHQNNTEESVRKIDQLIHYLGSSVVKVSATEHDEQVAGISHIVFLLSCYLYAFIEATQPKSLQLAGSGFESLTRLASGSPQMHTDIIIKNYDNIAVSLVAFMEFIKQHQLEKDSLLTFFTDTKTSRDTFISSRSQ